MSNKIKPWLLWMAVLFGAVIFLGASAQAGESPGAAPDTSVVAEDLAKFKVAMDTVWVLVTAMLVFFMNLGFACVESGFCRTKNTVNILSKNFIVFAISSIGFWLLGWGLMFGGGSSLVGTEGLWMVSGADNSPATGDAYQGAYGALNWTGVPLWAKFFFSIGVLWNGRNHCVGGGGREDQIL